MALSTRLITLDEIRPWREIYRREMACQIIHDSIHERPGWTQEYGLFVGDDLLGYGSVVVAGPWTAKPTATLSWRLVLLGLTALLVGWLLRRSGEELRFGEFRTLGDIARAMAAR